MRDDDDLEILRQQSANLEKRLRAVRPVQRTWYTDRSDERVRWTRPRIIQELRNLFELIGRIGGF